jgi:hypothetical protein
MTQTLFNTQAMILSRALATTVQSMSEELAHYLLTVKLDPVDESRANELAAKAREGALSAEEQAEIEEYRRVGRVMEILRLRARKTLGRKA